MLLNDMTGAEHDNNVHLTFVFGTEQMEVIAEVGMTILEVAEANDVPLEGNCGGMLACATCHIIVEDQEHFELLNEISDEEEEMLDLANNVTDHSRLGCQVKVTPEMDGIVITIPN